MRGVQEEVAEKVLLQVQAKNEDQKFQVFNTLLAGETICTDTTFSDDNVSEATDHLLPLNAQFCAMSSYYSKGKMSIKLSEDDIQDALEYYYRTATSEVEEFNKPELIEKIAVKRHGVLFHKSRILEGQRFVQAGDLEGVEVLRSQGINVLTPVIDRWSPLAYAIADHIHTDVAKHAGYESCLRASHSFVHIVKGLSLFSELAEDCTLCKKLQKRFIETAMGPIHPTKFTLAPPFWTTQADLWGLEVAISTSGRSNYR